MKVNWLYYLRTEFFKNAATLVSGSFSARLVLLLISPILTRIYTPEDFGVFALFTAITTITGMVANGKYDYAIGLPKERDEAINILALCVIISAVWSLLFFVIIIFFKSTIIQMLNSPQLEGFLLIAPIVTFLIGVFNSLNYFSIRLKNFKGLALTSFLQQVVSAIFQISLGFLKQGPLGLISGRVSFHFTGNLLLLIQNNIFSGKFHVIQKSEIIRLAKRYKRFPMFSLPAQLSNTLSQQLNNFFISTLFTTATLGFYDLLNRIVKTPLALIGKSLGQVYLERATKEKNKYGRSDNIYLKILFFLTISGLSICIPLYFLAEPFFGFLFGAEWVVAGTYTKILLPLLFIQFISSSLSVTNIVYEKQVFAMLWQIGLLLITIIIYLIATIMGLQIENFLMVYSYSLTIYYILLIIITYKFSKGTRT